ncbi:2-oxoglutarate dehydrogenase E1 component [Buchnera aphidicola]|uniref:oxoglutarate dehydrogenase (succinyl-transferring) n=1 Tax=Buchnera aphidicola (Sarucallis kahawaluokalani) TaxID=1241878 RepID=A0A4D6Y9E1_9GAMM|nr:2-oxoglutarate dehydrogenase E1 component [Buchnera aphidicola]QCI25999.1 2-oxoglutarate dehydrogenase E1 component [Buchnera aphidicola (Sarucallis kahawaluokalani)]
MKKIFSNNQIINYTYTNEIYIQNIYQEFIKNPNIVSDYWKNFFIKNPTYQRDEFNINTENINYILNHQNNFQVIQLLNFIRMYGHQYSYLNPLQQSQGKNELYSKIFKDFCLQNNIPKNISIILKNKELFKIYQKFINIYCQSIGIEYMHIDNVKERMWIQKYIEDKFLTFTLPKQEKKDLLNTLIQAEIFEKYLHTKFPGAKRFSLEGCEILNAVLKNIINYTYNTLTSKIIIGMAHRGRLNVLVNILNKPIHDLCFEFSEKYIPYQGTGDAKYHCGIKSQLHIKDKCIEIDLKPNPSHLEIINPVIMGAARAYIDSFEKINTDVILPINIHGDAAITGQGVIQELLNISNTRNYTVGGILHIIINNQIGFTTSSVKDIRSSRYCTDVAKMIQIPIFHVNADYPESVIFITKLALDFKYKFKKDVFIDLFCYRRRGHNEADDPNVTQPIMYQSIQQHPTVCKIYAKHLELKNIIDMNYFNNTIITTRKKIDLLSMQPSIKNTNKKNYHAGNIISKKINLKNLFLQINNIPDNIIVHERVLKIYQERKRMFTENNLLDWGSAENLAYANILSHGISCRLSGEDVGRGTFFHRHSILYDQNTGLSYIPLQAIKNCKSKFHICNSALSEEAILAFEYGYSIDSHNTINIWEAQFGDFVNGAQVVIDQFISSGEQKWGIKSKLILYLPHGYEGQGPEHSSARLERFLQLSAQNNMRICIPSTAAQMYHILMQQALSLTYMPLIIFTPKSLLRNSMAYSNFLELQKNSFQCILRNINYSKNNNIKKIIFCSGKIYYELLVMLKMHNIKYIVIIRIEQLYPFPKNEILQLLNEYSYIKEIHWCQEEPKNQGAWYYIYHKLKNIIPQNISVRYIGRSATAATAVGCISIHQKQQKQIISDALNI